jgi:hypothetical protein
MNDAGILALKNAAIEAVRDSLRVVKDRQAWTDNPVRAATAVTRSVVMQEAYALVLGVSLDLAARILHEEAERG